MRTNITTLLLLTLLLIPLGSTAQSHETGATDLYQNAQREYFSLKGDASRINDINAWRRILQEYRRIIEVYPNDPLVDDILYITAGLYREMYQQFGERSYLQSAIDQYQTVLRLYPDSYLQQAALFAVGEIEETHQKSPAKALQTYSTLVDRFPRGYKTAMARERIEKIRSELNGTTTKTVSTQPVAQPLKTAAHSETKTDTAELKPVVDTASKSGSPNLVPVAQKNSAFGSYTSQQRRPGQASIVDIRMSFSKDVGRVAIELDQEISFEYRQLPAPNRRIYFDLKNVNLAKSLLKSDTIEVENRYLKKIRLGQHSRSVVRLVMDFADFRDYTVFHLPGPGDHFRIVFDLHRPGDGPRYVSANGNNNPVGEPDADIPLGDGADKNSSGQYSIARQLGTKITTVVLDPGHGGKDVGAVGFKGLNEAKLNLDIAKRLQQIFAREYPEVTVKLTRESNSFVSLDTRPAKSKVMEGDIFVSLHSNSARRGKASGIETYYLNFAASDSEAAELAAKENALSSLKQAQLESIVKKITTFSKKEESRELAQFLQKHLYQQTKAVNASARNRGVKSAPFVVLIGTSVPSVLVEVGFINHSIEGKLLTQESYRERIARGLFNGIKAYIESLN